MVIFNRIVAILLLLALIPVITVGLVVPREAAQLVRDELDRLDVDRDSSVSTGQLFVRVALALVVDGLLVLLLYLQLRRPVQHEVPVPKAEGGEAKIAVKSVVDRLVYQIDPLPGVLAVKPTIIPRSRGVEVSLEIETTTSVNFPSIIEDVSAVARQVVEDEMGLVLKGKPKLSLRTVAYPGPVGSREILTPASDEPDGGTIQKDLPHSEGDSSFSFIAGETMNAGDVDEPGSLASVD